jgi:branched-chain amino acid transport system ATP-binding protein
MSHVLELSQVDAYYGKIQALKGITLSVKEGEIAALLGSNGAGKSTTLKTISGLIRVRNGSIRFMGEDISKLEPHEIVERGIVHVPEGRRIFGGLTVTENLELGGFTKRKDPKFMKRTLEHVFELFPRLKEREKQKAGTLSGGEQQMVAIGRAIMSGPKLLMLDEPSMGLAPIVVQEIMKIIKRINEEGTTVLLVEQNAKAALKLAHTGYVMENGEITLHDKAETLRQDDSIIKAYLAYH